MSSHVTIEIPIGGRVTVPLSAIGAAGADFNANTAAICNFTAQMLKGIAAPDVNVDANGAVSDQSIAASNRNIDAQTDADVDVDFDEVSSTANPKAGSYIVTLDIGCRSGQTFNIMISTLETVQSLKSQIYSKIGMLPDRQTLLYAGRQMPNEDTLDKYYLMDGSCVHLVDRHDNARLYDDDNDDELSSGANDGDPSSTFTLYVKTCTGKVLEITASPGDKAQAVKRKIEQKEGIPTRQQVLVFKNKEMHHMKTLDEFGVKEGAFLYLVLTLRGS